LINPSLPHGLALISSSTNLFTTSFRGAGLSTCTNPDNALTWNNGIFGCNSITGGSGDPFAWTYEPTWGVSTSTTLGFFQGFISTASSTFTGGFIANRSTTTNATTTTIFSDTASSTNLFATIGNIGTLTVSSCTGCATGGGITSLGAEFSTPQTGVAQTFATSTTGTDFAIISSGDIHTFYLPSASSVNRGLLTSADWSTFDSKENALTFSTGLNRSVDIITIDQSFSPTWTGSHIFNNINRSTTSEATTTSLFSTTASSTNLFATAINSVGNITSTGLSTLANLLVTGSTTLQNITFLNSTSTNATTTNLFSTTASSTNLFSTSLLTGAITGTGALNLGANTITSGLINSQTISNVANFTGTLNVTSGLTTLSNLLVTSSSTLQNFTFVNATGTSATTTNFFSDTASSTNLFATALNAGNSTLGAITSGLINSQTISSAASFTGTLNVTSGLSTLSNLLLTGSSTLQNFTFVNATGTSATTTNFAISSITSALLKTDPSGSLIAAIAGTDYENPLTFSTGLNRSVDTVTVDQSFSPTWTGIHIFDNILRSTTTNATTTTIFSDTASSTNLFSTNANFGTILQGLWNGTRIGLGFGGTNADLSGTGGAGQILRQSGVGSAITVGTLASTELSDTANIALLDNIQTFTGAKIFNDITRSTTTNATTTTIFSGTASSTNLFATTGNIGTLTVSSCAGCGGATFANPTAVVGLTAVNGVLTTAMRSDAAPALDVGITPTWTGAHIFNNITRSTTTNATTTTIFSGTASSTNLFSTTANIGALTTGNLTSGGSIDLSAGIILGSSPFVFEGSTVDAFKTTFVISNPTLSSKTITFPDASITVNAASDISGTTLAFNVLSSSLTSLGTISSLSATAAIVPLVTGGSAAGSSLNLRSTSGVGTTDFIRFTVGSAGATEAMRILNNGNIGIATTTPNNPLDIFSATKAAISFSGGATAGQWTMGYDVSNGRFAIASSTVLGTTDRLTISGTGLVTLANLLATASSTLQNFTALNSTSTNATTTNLFSTTASSTNLFATALNAGNSILGAITSALINSQTISSTASFTGTVGVATSLTSPIVIGGSAAGSTLSLRSTSGVGTSDAIIFQIGNNGGTEAARITNGSFTGFGTTTPQWQLQLASSTRSQLTLSDPSLLTNNHWSFRNAGGNLYFATSSPLTFATSTYTSFSISGTTGNVGIGTPDPGSKLDILEPASSAQLRLRQNGAVIAGLYLNSAGDLIVSATGENIRFNNENLWICSGGSCDTVGKPTAGNTGNLILEKALYFDNNFRFAQTGAAEVTMYASSTATIVPVLIFDDIQ
jgi:hypothetical protein